jgi:RNA-directed DNA polymerase
VPTVADRIAQTVVALQLEARTESIFHRDSYGYRLRKSAHDALRKCGQRCWKSNWVVDLDIEKFFDSWIMISSSERWRRTPTRNGFCCI